MLNTGVFSRLPLRRQGVRPGVCRSLAKMHRDCTGALFAISTGLCKLSPSKIVSAHFTGRFYTRNSVSYFGQWFLQRSNLSTNGYAEPCRHAVVELREMLSALRTLNDKGPSYIIAILEKLHDISTDGFIDDIGDIFFQCAGYISSHPGKLDALELINCLKYLQDYEVSSTPGLDDLFMALYKSIMGNGLSTPIASVDACKGLYFLKSKSSDTPEIRKLAIILGAHLHSSGGSLELKVLCQAIEGLRNFKSIFPESRELMSLLAVELQRSFAPEDNETFASLSHALGSLIGMKSDVEEVCLLLKILHSKMLPVKMGVTPDLIAVSFFGLQSMSTQATEVKSMLSLLHEKMVLSLYQPFSSKEIAMSLYGLKSMRLTKEIKSILSVLSNKINEFHAADANSTFSASDLEMAFYGLKNFNDNCKPVKDLVASMGIAISRHLTINGSSMLQGSHLARMLHGLGSMGSDSEQLRVLLKIIKQAVQDVNSEYRLKDLLRAVVGMKRFNGARLEVRQLMLVLTEKLNGKQLLEEIDMDNRVSGRYLVNAISSVKQVTAEAESIGNNLLLSMMKHFNEVGVVRDVDNFADNDTHHHVCYKLLFLMESLSDGYPEVDKMLRHIGSSLVLENEIPLTDQMIGRALLGLRGMSSNSFEVLKIIAVINRDIYRLIASKGDENSGLFSVHSIVNCFRGISGFCCESIEVRELLKILAILLNSCRESFSGQDIATCYWGLNRMSGHHEEVLHVLSELNKCHLRSHIDMSPSDISKAMFGLRNMESCVGPIAEAYLIFSKRARKCLSDNRDTVDEADMKLLLHVVNPTCLLEKNGSKQEIFLPIFQLFFHNIRNRPKMKSIEFSIHDIATLLSASYIVKTRPNVFFKYIAARLSMCSVLTFEEIVPIIDTLRNHLGDASGVGDVVSELAVVIGSLNCSFSVSEFRQCAYVLYFLKKYARPNEKWFKATVKQKLLDSASRLSASEVSVLCKYFDSLDNMKDFRK